MKRIFSIGLALYFLGAFFLIFKDAYHETSFKPPPISLRKETCLIPYMKLYEEKSPFPNRESFLSARFAQWNDLLIKCGNKYWTRIPATFIGTRIFATTLFPVTLCADFVYSSGKCIYHGTIGDSTHLKRYWQRVQKNVLGLITTPVSLLSPDLVTNHFIPVGKARRAICPYGKLYSANAIELYPQTVEEVQEIVQKAKTLDKKISIAGTLFSQGKQALPRDNQQILLHLDALNQIEIDVENKFARCGPSATWKELQEAANEEKLAVRVMQASNPFSIGGSLSINCHGWDHKSGSVGQSVRTLKLVDSFGNLHVLHPEDELFHLAIGGLGGFGVIVEAELTLTDNSLCTCIGEVIDPNAYVDYFRTKILQDPKIALHYFRLSLEPGKLFEEGIAVNYSEIGPAERADLKEECEKGRVIDRIELQTLRRLRSLYRFAWREEKREALQSYIATRNEIMQPPIRAILSESELDTEWLQEFFIKPEHLATFLKKLAVILHREKVALLNASVRYISANQSKSFNYSPNGERFAVVLFFNQSLAPKEVSKARKWVRETVDILHELGGSYYLAYQSFPTIDQFHQSYPDWQKVVGFKQKWDPERRFDSGFFSDYLSVSETLPSKPAHYRKLFSKKTGKRTEIEDFISNIFMQVDAKKFFALVDDILLTPALHVDLYPLLQSRISEAKKDFFPNLLDLFSSLSQLKNELGDQVHDLLGNQSLRNYLEIGYPGRMIRPLKKRLNLSGKMIVVNQNQSLSDYLQTGIPTPVDQFVPLNDYEPISAESVPTESVDLVSLFIGLHHIPTEKLIPFIRSIERVLRPGGSLIFMDHDAKTEEMKDFLSLIHSIFNVANSVPVEEEREEFRNFQPLSYWINLLGKNGLVWDEQQPRIRKGDSSLNSLIILKKPHTDPSQPKEGALRLGIQTFLTGPEWQNVRSAKSYATFIEHTPFYAFPYFRELGNFWHVYKESWKAARCHYSMWQVATSEYTFMNTFIGVMMTIEYGAKGLISLPLSWFYTQESLQEPLTTHVLVKANALQSSSDVRLIEKSNDFLHLEIPRYKKGSFVLQELALTGVDFLSIEGHDRIQVDLLIDQNSPHPKISASKFLYETKVFQKTPKTLVAYEMPVQILAENIRYLSKQEIEIDLIHDY